MDVRAALGEFAPLYAAMNELTLRERRVLELRYGLVGEEVHTLAEIGRTFAVSPERIRQLEDGALRKLATHIESADTSKMVSGIDVRPHR